MALYDAEQRRQRRAKADAIDAVFYGRARTDKGIRAMQRLVDELRHD